MGNNAFSVCVGCEPCGSRCAFLDNKVTFVANSRRGRVTRLLFDTSLATCGGECGKECVTDFRLVKMLKHFKTTTI